MLHSRGDVADFMQLEVRIHSMARPEEAYYSEKTAGRVR